MRAPVRQGETVLVLGATGTLGAVAVQTAKLLGAGRVVAAGRRPEALERARELGADAVVRLDEVDDLAAAFREACAGVGPSLVIDPLWGAPLVAALEAAAPFARVVQIGQSAGPEATHPVGPRARKVPGHPRLHDARRPHDVLSSGYGELVENAAAGRIRIDLERMSLENAVEAWRRQREGADAKLVVCP